MNYAFFGTPDFAAIILEKLIAAGMPPALVVCNPDRPVGRKKVITPPPVKQTVMNYEVRIKNKGKNKIHLLQPNKLDQSFHDSLFMLHNSFQFGIVAAYAKIIPQSVIHVFPRGIIGLHPSLLPKHRGASPMQSSILAGDKETGVTLFMIDKEVDHGPILAQGTWKMENDENYKGLEKKLADLGAQMLIATLPKFIAGKITPREQDHAQVTFTKKFTSEDGFVKPEDLLRAQSECGEIATYIDRKIRALNPEPGVWTTENGKRKKLLEAQNVGGKLVLKKIQIEGKKPITI